MVVHDWSVDSVSFCDLCAIIDAFFRGMHFAKLVSIQGTAQILVAGVGIYQPEWVVTPWQTCG